MRNTPLMNRVREMILSEELAPGSRITEEGLAELLGVSRTPVRRILPTLAAEGFLRGIGRVGYAVASFSDQESIDALELRAILEGQAARLLALRGATDQTLLQLQECLAEGDRLFDKQVRSLNRDEEQQYGTMNERFHNIIVEASGFQLLKVFIDRLNLLPFVAPGVIVFDQGDMRRAYEGLYHAHDTHHSIVDAIRSRDGARAEVLFREHGHQQHMSMFSRRQHHRDITQPATGTSSESAAARESAPQHLRQRTP